MTKVLSIKDVAAQLKVSRSTVYAMMNRGVFPRPFKMGERKNAWTSRQVEDWIAKQEAASAADNA